MGQRDDQGPSAEADARLRRTLLAVLLIPVVIAVYLSRTYLGLALFPEGANIGPAMADAINSFTDGFVASVDTFTNAFKNVVTYGLLNPLQSLLGRLAVVADGAWCIIAGGLPARWLAPGRDHRRVRGGHLRCRAVERQRWQTLTMTLVATVLVMVVAIVLGVWMGRSRRADTGIRPVLDAFQTIPPFVYLVPALALFGATRFTAIVAAVAYAVPIATKLVADGIRGVSPTTVEAARAAGITSLADDHARCSCRWPARRSCWPPTRACSTCCPWS